jgi:GAF domain-containing protein
MVEPSRPAAAVEPVEKHILLRQLVRATERVDEAADLDELWAVVATEAARMLGTNAKVMQWMGERWVVVLTEVQVEGERSRSVLSRASAPTADAADDEESTADHRSSRHLRPGIRHARSVLVTDLECSGLRTPTRLVWTSSRQDAFRARADLAADYRRFTIGAIRRCQVKFDLQREVAARHRIGRRRAS